MVTCGMCGARFVEDRGQAACRSCPLGADCGFVRCPACRYENPREPGWIGALRSLLGGARGGAGDGAGAGTAVGPAGPGTRTEGAP